MPPSPKIIIHTILNTLYTKARNKGKKETRNIKEVRKRNGGSHYVIQLIERHNPFKLFSLYTFYAIDYNMYNL